MPQTQGDINREHLFAGILQIYLYYRFVVALVLLGAFITHLADHVFGRAAPSLYLSTAIVYVVLSAIALGFYQLQGRRLRPRQLFVNLLADIAIQTILMFCSGGLGSGLGYLMLVTVTLGGIFFTGQMAVLIPAIASICIILESIVSAALFELDTINVFPAGVLGVLLFASALIFSRLSNALIDTQKNLKNETAFSAGLKELNELIIDRMRTGILVVDGNAMIHQINYAARELLGRDEEQKTLGIGASIRGEAKLLQRLLQWKREPNIKTEAFIPRFGTSELLVNFANLEATDPDRTIIFLEDLRSQAQQAQQLKLASLGRLTGSIAHEIRNPLGAISHASELLNEISQEDPTATRLTEIINTHVKRVNHIVENVLQLSRKQNHHPETIDLTQWLADFLKDYGLGSRNNPAIDLTFKSAEIQPITFDPIQLQRVLTNLLDNAVRYSLQETAQPWAEIAVSLQVGTPTVVLDVLDKGTGVPQEHRSQLFEPFFSTSPGGSGLGLYIARELCAINYASLKYQGPEEGKPGYFRITFVHPNKILK